MDFDCSIRWIMVYQFIVTIFYSQSLAPPLRSLSSCSNQSHPPTLFCNHCTCIIFSSKQNNSSQTNNRFRQSKLANLPPQALKHLWIRTALMEKLLDKIVLFLVENSRYRQWTWTENTFTWGKVSSSCHILSVLKLRSGFNLCFLFLQNMTSCSSFYEKEAMLMDPVDGPILASLLGIYCRLKTFTTLAKNYCFCTSCINVLFMGHSWPLCIGVHQGENCWPLLDGPIGWRAGAAAPHPQ